MPNMILYLTCKLVDLCVASFYQKHDLVSAFCVTQGNRHYATFQMHLVNEYVLLHYLDFLNPEINIEVTIL